MGSNFYDYEQYLDQDQFYLKDELLSTNPSIHLFIKNSLLMKDRNTFYLYKQSNLDSRGISSNLLYDLIQQPGMNMYLLSMLDLDSSTAVDIQLFENNRQVDVITINKADLITSYMELLNKDNTFSPEDQMRVHMLEGFNSTNTCLSYYADEVYKCLIDGEEYELPAKSILDLLLCSDRDYKDFLTLNLYIYPKEIIAYMIVNFVEKEQLFSKYVFEDRIKQRYEELKSQQIIDFESVNKLQKTDDVFEDGSSLLNSFTITEDLRNKIFEGMNPEYDKVEQAIYVYIKLCDLLTYDDENYLSNTMFEKQGIHSNIENISAIDSDENKIVSYEFIFIYAKLLNELGIKYSTHLNSFAGVSITKSTLDAKFNKYLFKVDLFKDILDSDLTNVKVGKTLTGISSTNTSNQTKQLFDEKLYNVYSEYKKKQSRNEEFEHNIELYAKRYYRNPNISRRTKLFTILKLIARKDLQGLDSVSYVKETFNNIFAGDPDVSIYICSKTVKHHIRPVNIVTVNDNDSIIYFVVDASDKDLIKVFGQRELNRLFEKGVYKSVNDTGIKGIGDEDESRSSKRKM